jgi:hypothetical protein
MSHWKFAIEVYRIKKSLEFASVVDPLANSFFFKLDTSPTSGIISLIKSKF